MKNLFLSNSHVQKELRMQLPIALRTLRVNAGLKQETVAEFLQISRPTYSYYEIGTTAPNVFTLYLLCQFYDVPIDAFFLPGAVKSLHPGQVRVRKYLKAPLPEKEAG